MHVLWVICQRCCCWSAGSGHVYQLEELVALVPRRAAAAGEMPQAWPGVCRLPASGQQAIDEVTIFCTPGTPQMIRDNLY